jgi:beta-lactamase class A
LVLVASPTLCESDHFASPLHPIPLLCFPAESFFGQAVRTHAMAELMQSRLITVQYVSEFSLGLREMALIHQGAAWLPRSLVAKDLERGSLRELVTLSSNVPLTIMAYFSRRNDEALQTLVDRLSDEIEPNLRPHVLILDGQTLQFAGKRMEEEVPSASVIKLPLLYLYTLHLNSGTLTNETPAYFDEHHMVSGSGDWQFLGAKKFYTAFQTAEAMIQNSDNSATELMTSLLGGKNEVTQELKDLGLQHTALRNILPDVEGYNTISVYDMVTLLFNLKEQPLLSTETKSTAMEILEGTRNRRLIPALLPPDTLVAHKTGDIGKSLGETALVYLPDGRY